MYWLAINSQLINVQRLGNMQKKLGICAPRMFSALAAYMDRIDHTSKWSRIAKLPMEAVESLEPMFYRKDGMPIPTPDVPDPDFTRFGYARNTLLLRKMSQTPQPGNPSATLLQLHGLFGLNVRAEIILLLLAHEALSNQAITEKSFYFVQSIRGVLQDLSASGLLVCGNSKRNRTYSVHWKDWAWYYAVAARLMDKLEDGPFQRSSVAAQAAVLRRLLLESHPGIIENAGLVELFASLDKTQGERIYDVIWDGISHDQARFAR